MKLTRQERADRRDAFRRMTWAGKLEYVFAYYKLPLFLLLLLAYVVGYGAYRHFTKQEVLLYAACVNVAAGEDTDAVLGEAFVRFTGSDTRKCAVYLYRDLYLSDDPTLANHEYAYASRLKLLAAVSAEQLDVVLMNREAYDLLSGSGYLLELPPFLSESAPALYRKVQPFLTDNDVVLEDNAVEYSLNEAERYEAVTVRQINGVEVSGFPALRDAAFTDAVYWGVIANSPRLSRAADYLAYLAAG